MYEWAKLVLGVLIWVFWFHTEPPPVIQVPNNVTVTPGERAVLACLVSSAVDYNLTWQRSGRDVRLADSARIRTLANLSLELRSVKIGDAGEYRCMATNEGGSATASVFLIVQGTVLLATSTQWCPSIFLLHSLFIRCHVRVALSTQTVICGWKNAWDIQLFKSD